MKLKIKQVREAVIEVDRSLYPAGSTDEQIIAMERSNAEECIEYMDACGASEEITITIESDEG